MLVVESVEGRRARGAEGVVVVVVVVEDVVGGSGWVVEAGEVWDWLGRLIVKARWRGREQKNGRRPTKRCLNACMRRVLSRD